MLYHLSNIYLGQAPILNPRIPRDRMRFENETVPRICVSECIQGCLTALKNTYYNNGVWFIYTTLGECEEAINVPDAHITGEKWVLSKQKFFYAGQVAQNLSAACKNKKLFISKEPFYKSAQCVSVHV